MRKCDYICGHCSVEFEDMFVYDIHKCGRNDFVIATADICPHGGSSSLCEWCGYKSKSQFLEAQSISDRALIEKLGKALDPLIDDDNCWLDHNGSCQAHGFFGGRCCVAIAKEVLVAYKEWKNNKEKN